MALRGRRFKLGGQDSDIGNSVRRMFGLFNINKPSGISSRDVVNRVQRLVRPAKAGHAGTLDPLASGVLITCVGPATRLVSYVQRMPKRYRATFLLGLESDTEDVEGNVRVSASPTQPSCDELNRTLARFLGDIEQRPPAYSALKVNGQRAYKLARKGQPMELAARTVTIHGLQLVSYEYPRVQLEVECGSGTYIRSLGRDIAATLGTTAVMSELTRTAIGTFRIEDAVQFAALSHDSLRQYLLPATLATAALPKRTLTDEEMRRVSHGMTIDAGAITPTEEIAALDSRGQLMAILCPRAQGRWGPLRNFVKASAPSQSDRCS